MLDHQDEGEEELHVEGDNDDGRKCQAHCQSCPDGQETGSAVRAPVVEETGRRVDHQEADRVEGQPGGEDVVAGGQLPLQEARVHLEPLFVQGVTGQGGQEEKRVERDEHSVRGLKFFMALQFGESGHAVREVNARRPGLRSCPLSDYSFLVDNTFHLEQVFDKDATNIQQIFDKYSTNVHLTHLGRICDALAMGFD